LNIHNMVNKSRGDLAFTLVDVECAVPQAVIDQLTAIGGVLRVRYAFIACHKLTGLRTGQFAHQKQERAQQRDKHAECRLRFPPPDSTLSADAYATEQLSAKTRATPDHESGAPEISRSVR